MSDTMITMARYVLVDRLAPDQLESGDIIKFDGEFVEVESVSYLEDGYSINAVNDFGEEFEVYVADNVMLDWYIYEY
jgi:uncharacterized protein YciU (UPF0263 family)